MSKNLAAAIAIAASTQSLGYTHRPNAEEIEYRKYYSEAHVHTSLLENAFDANRDNSLDFNEKRELVLALTDIKLKRDTVEISIDPKNYDEWRRCKTDTIIVVLRPKREPRSWEIREYVPFSKIGEAMLR